MSQQTSGYFSITLKTKPYLKKYLHALYGDPLIFTLDNFFGMSVAGLLENPIDPQRKKQDLRLRCDRFGTDLLLYCPLNFIRKSRYGTDICEKQTISINKLFEERFEEDVFRYCHTLKLVGVEIKDALEEFCRIYNIEIDVDITYEAIKKKEFRYRKNLEQISPQLSLKKSASFQTAFF